jgi:hypothetical protein
MPNRDVLQGFTDFSKSPPDAGIVKPVQSSVVTFFHGATDKGRLRGIHVRANLNSENVLFAAKIKN